MQTVNVNPRIVALREAARDQQLLVNIVSDWSETERLRESAEALGDREYAIALDRKLFALSAGHGAVVARLARLRRIMFSR
jgi:hypothetical protein